MKAFLILHDNGESYEDHAITELAITLRKGRAIALVKKLNRWIERRRENAPPNPIHEEGLSEADYTKMTEAEDAYFAALRLPYGEECFRVSARYGDGTVLSIELPLLS